PADNPTSFAGINGSPTGIGRAIWAVGLRNPFTSAFQSGTGRFFINDVGNTTYEGQIDDGIAGANYGWPITEGPNAPPPYSSPLYAYGQSVGFAITGGAFYNPTTVEFPSSYVGGYFFSDWAANWMKILNPTTLTVTTFATNLPSGTVNEFVDPSGSLYYLSRGHQARAHFTTHTTDLLRTDYPTS